MTLGEGMEDLYIEKRSTKHLYVILAVVFVVVVVFWVVSASDKTVQTRGLVEKCGQLFDDSNQAYFICCIENDDVVDCSERQVFTIDDYIIVYADLLLLNQDLSRYHVCGFYTALETTDVLGEYELEQMYVSGEVVVCSKELRRRSQFFENSGKIKETGDITLMRIYLFESDLYNSTRDFVNNIEKGRLVLNLTAEVE